MSKFQPFLDPSELGISLEADSEDVEESEVATAIDTESVEDFVEKARQFISDQPPAPLRHERRLKGGIYYCRVLVGDHKQLFRAEWLRRTE